MTTNRGFQNVWWLAFGTIILVLGVSLLGELLPENLCGEFGSSVIGEFMIILPCIAGIFLIEKKYKGEQNWREYIGVKKFKPILIPLLIFLPMAAQYFAVFVSMYATTFSYFLFGTPDQGDILPQTALGTVQMIFSLCVLAPVLEELLCRGIIMKMLEKYGIAAEILVSAIIFAMLHVSAQSMIAIFFIGMLFGAVKKVTGSIIPGMIMHCVNNGMSFAMTAVTENNTVPQTVFVVWAAVLVATFPFMIVGFLKIYKDVDTHSFIFTPKMKKGLSVGLILSIAVCVVFNLMVIAVRIKSGELTAPFEDFAAQIQSFVLP